MEQTICIGRLKNENFDLKGGKTNLGELEQALDLFLLHTA